MKILTNKKGGEGTVAPFRHIVEWIILFALLAFALFWFSGLGNKIIAILKSFF
ncbi:MAG: hypothetical protein QF917_00130 [Candidatus Woesearchaeota archaeon]|jgi:hypothetical protein|nr:hypothetical protein [Candidatus Woesearchaeota archaeon]|tara:strand:- start:16359 stop:16517 length:159 start_codon:yes stop_codon:yes gene_type:complete